MNAFAACLLGLSLVTCHLSLGFADELSAFAKATAAYQERRLDEALNDAREAVRQEPDHVDAHVLLGELYYLRQELDQARQSWERALTLAPSRQDVRERLQTLQRESQVERSLARQDTYPFIVRFAEGQTPVDLGALQLLLRDAYRLVGQQFSYFPEHPIPVLLYAEPDFDAVKGVSHQLAGLYDGKIRLPLRPGQLTGEDLTRILWHEYTHALVHDLAKGRCPLWLNEGIATVQEARIHPPPLDEALAALKAGRLIPWAALWDEREYHADTTAMRIRYEEGYWIAQYLVKLGGWTQLTALLKRLSWGTPIADALKTEYHMDQRVLEQEWMAWLRRTHGL